MALIPGNTGQPAQAHNGLELVSGHSALTDYNFASGSGAAGVATGGGSFGGSPVMSYNMTKVGALVVLTLRLAGTYTVIGNVFAVGLSLPAGFTTTVAQACSTVQNGTGSIYQLQVNAAGQMQIAKFASNTGSPATFTNSEDTFFVSGGFVIS